MTPATSPSPRQAFWSDPLPLPAGLRLQHLQAVTVPRRGRGGESVLDLARLHVGGTALRLIIAYRPAPTPKDVVSAKRSLAAAADALRLSRRAGDGVGDVPAIAADVASRAVIDLCVREGLAVIDRTGTVIVRQGPVFVHVIGRAPVDRTRRLRPFAGRACRVVRFLLAHPSGRFTAHEVAVGTAVSYAFAFTVLTRLEREGFAWRPSPRGGFGLRDGRGLLRAWIDSPDARPASITPYYAPNTRPEALAKAAEAASANGVRAVFTLASGLESGDAFVAGLPHGAYVSGDAQAFVDALGLQDSTPHNFWILRADPAAETVSGGILAGTRALQHGEGVALPQLAVDFAAVPGRGKDQAEFLLDRYAETLDLAGEEP
jgi:hypothetical protein